MKEDKIIKYIKDEIENETDTFHWFDDVPENQTRKQIEESIKAHQGLLDLYEKEVQKNKELERQIKIKNAYLTLIWDIGYDYDGCETSKSLKGLIDELLKMCNQAYKNDDKSVMYEDLSGKNKKNILQELLND